MFSTFYNSFRFVNSKADERYSVQLLLGRLTESIGYVSGLRIRREVTNVIAVRPTVKHCSPIRVYPHEYFVPRRSNVELLPRNFMYSIHNKE
jgi:hypothetical protein